MLYPQNFSGLSRQLLTTLPLLAALLFSGCGQKKAEPATAADGSKKNAAASQTPQTAQAEPEANLYVDEAMLAKPYAIIGGTVENVGAGRLEQLSVEIELKRRADGAVERRAVAVEPAVLEKGKQGRFRLKVLSEEWSSSRVVSLRSGARTQEVAYKTLPGAKRPPEKFENKTVVLPPARKKSGGGSGDFINTPDTPYKVP
ncbi:MAG TPA: hypothetical protein VJ866_13620 [Pyrinomonadaceae bacterium]|nr:hypothetical protein [Pyrinomonadaceae bacterium]